jgi:hypothetical protein
MSSCQSWRNIGPLEPEDEQWSMMGRIVQYDLPDRRVLAADWLDGSPSTLIFSGSGGTALAA